MWKKLQMCWGKVLNQNNYLTDGGKRSGGYEKELLAARTEALRLELKIWEQMPLLE